MYVYACVCLYVCIWVYVGLCTVSNKPKSASSVAAAHDDDDDGPHSSSEKTRSPASVVPTASAAAAALAVAHSPPYPSKAIFDARKRGMLLMKGASSSASFEDESSTVLPVRPQSSLHN